MLVTLDLRKHTHEVVDSARMAPSLDNAQPWAFRVTARSVEVYVDRSRAVPSLDPDDRQMLIGVGGAIFAVRLGICALGSEPTLALLPGDERGDLAAVVSLGPDHLFSLAEARMFEQIPRRRTCHARLDPQVPREIRSALARAVELEGAHLRWMVESAERRSLARLVAMAERREQAGQTVHAAGSVGTAAPATARHGSDLPTREFATASSGPAATPGLPAQEPSVAILATDGDRPAEWLRAGQALMRMLLSASVEGLVATYSNQPLEVPDLRGRVRDDLALPGFPQVIVRLGRPVEGWPEPTPRRPVVDLLRR
ncbi:Acg family FMN-binding oxidoreductase [Actinopolymorpha pittospori]|uniref:Acg family FMN-binding oxidoreductase n=1 Tax=Actinopolymorpha pittospori TaxID=648752 RepID=UPI0031F18D03